MYEPLGAMAGRSGSGSCPLGPLLSVKALSLVFFPSFLAFVLLDLLWITVVAKDLYAPLKPILKPQPDAVAALASWLCIVAGNYAFVLPRTGGNKAAWHIVGQGALFGFLLYGTVDLTNCALVTSWGWRITATDMVWGSVASAVLALTQRSLASSFPSLGLM